MTKLFDIHTKPSTIALMRAPLRNGGMGLRQTSLVAHCADLLKEMTEGSLPLNFSKSLVDNLMILKKNNQRCSTI